MSYQVIARKWRPQTFEEVTGQETITQTLRNALEFDRLHHAYLFSGARGVGKTTTARLLAKALNCHKADKPNILPCRTDDPTACPSCIEITESRSMDVLEIDAASHTGVDDIRETILEGINVRAARDRYKVFIVDEVHMLSKSSFNALLKTLEEPPPNVVFIMATTEPHKVPETILSRCQEFEFRTIPLQKIFDRLRLIAKAEKVNISDDAVKEIARSGEGSMRDAQSNFDQVISFSGEKIEAADVSRALGLAGSEMLVRTMRAVAEKQPRAVLDVVADLTSRGHDLRNFCRDLLSLCRDMLVFKVSDGDEKLSESAALSPEELRELSGLFSGPDIVRYFNSLADTELKLREALQSRYFLEIGLVKLIEMRTVTAVEDLMERLAGLEARLSDGGPPPADKTDAAAATPEKKTLNAAPAPEEPAFFESPNRTFDEPIELVSVDFPEPETPSAFKTEPPPKPDIAYDLAFLDSIDLPLPDISSEELEHVDDDWLDNAYEQRLSATGDDLKAIPAAAQLATDALKRRSTHGLQPANGTTGGQASAAAPAIDLAPFVSPVFDEMPEIEAPALSSDPTPEELLAYANANRVIRSALRIFGGTIKTVRKR